MNRYSLGLGLGLGSVIISYYYYKKCLQNKDLNKSQLEKKNYNSIDKKVLIEKKEFIEKTELIDKKELIEKTDNDKEISNDDKEIIKDILDEIVEKIKNEENMMSSFSNTWTLVE